jgi:hypothetical protein
MRSPASSPYVKSAETRHEHRWPAFVASIHDGLARKAAFLPLIGHPLQIVDEQLRHRAQILGAAVAIAVRIAVQIIIRRLTFARTRLTLV